MPMAQLIDVVKDYPIEDRVVVADAILQSICPVDPEVESRWLSVVRRRRAEYRAGRVKTVSSDEVFAEAFKRVSV